MDIHNYGYGVTQNAHSLFYKKTFYSNPANFKWLSHVIDWIVCCSRFDMPPFIRKLVDYFANYDLNFNQHYGMMVTE